MKRLLPIIFGLLLSAAAQEHKISVQKYEVPVYPPIARQARVEGDVKLALEVNADGTVTSAKVTSGYPLLTRGLEETMKKWRFHCEDCRYGAAFKHDIVVAFRLVDHEERHETWMQFPTKIIVYADTPIVVTTNSAISQLDCRRVGLPRCARDVIK